MKPKKVIEVFIIGIITKVKMYKKVQCFISLIMTNWPSRKDAYSTKFLVHVRSGHQEKDICPCSRYYYYHLVLAKFNIIFQDFCEPQLFLAIHGSYLEQNK